MAWASGMLVAAGRAWPLRHDGHRSARFLTFPPSPMQINRLTVPNVGVVRELSWLLLKRPVLHFGQQV